MATAAAKGATAATGSAQEAIGNVAAAAAGAQNAGGAQGNADSVKGIAEGMKEIVEVAAKMGVELKAAAGAAEAANNAGHLFATANGAGATAAQAGNAAEVVSKVSGQQIIKAIIDSDANGNGAAPAAATSPIDAAIGAAAGAGGDFGQAGMTGNDKIAAAIVLRGMAADGKFALAQAEAAAVNGLKSTVEGELSRWITEMATAAAKGTTAATGTAEQAIGNCCCWCW
ncbi:variable large family protein [Borreliella lusitaniae]|uniref:variable large family protein n=1 Tax=Borreliella lusitaniae TaxID=100177 RepID=UPI003AB24FBE